jgi:hypothetical protein
VQVAIVAGSATLQVRCAFLMRCANAVQKFQPIRHSVWPGSGLKQPSAWGGPLQAAGPNKQMQALGRLMSDAQIIDWCNRRRPVQPTLISAPHNPLQCITPAPLGLRLTIPRKESSAKLGAILRLTSYWELHMCAQKIKKVLAAKALLFCVVATAYAADTPQALTPAEPLNKVRPVVSPDNPSDNPSDKFSDKSSNPSHNKNTAAMLECGRGYVVGIWPGADGWDDWGVWLSATGPSYSNSDVKFYRAYSNARTNYNSGRMYYSAALQAMATGAMFMVLDDDLGFRCNVAGTGNAKGPQFDSVQIWYP